MSFDHFLAQSWNDHGKDAWGVFKKFPDGIALVDKNEQIPRLAQLIAHVSGEHLGAWDQGIDLLQKLRHLSCFESSSESDAAINRLSASLEIAAGKNNVLTRFSQSDQIRILATAASALCGQNKSTEAETLFKHALELARPDLDKTDPACRSLAVTGNNLACSLEEKSERSTADTQLMILAAETARKYWELAGTWLEIERAEYRLAMTYLVAKDFAKAHAHAQNCIDLAKSNAAAPLELFFGFEALALVEHARNAAGFSSALEQMQHYFSVLSADDQSWCDKSLQKLIQLSSAPRVSAGSSG